MPIAVVVYFLIGYAVPGKTTGRTRWRDVDFGGSLSLLLSIGSLLLCLQSKHANYALACASAAFFAVFIAVELKYARFPVLPLALLRRRVPLCVGIISGVIAIVNFNMLYHLPMVFEIVFGQSLSQAGAHVLPNSLAMAVVAPLSGLYVRRTRRYKWAIVLSACGPFAAMILLSRLRPDSNALVQWAAVVPMGTGFGALLTLTLVANLNTVSRAEIATATGFVFVFRSIGQVLGVGISDAVFQTGLSRELERRFTDEKLIDRLRHASSIIKKLPMAERILAREAYGAALKNTFVFGAIGAAIVLVTSFFVSPSTRTENRARLTSRSQTSLCTRTRSRFRRRGRSMRPVILVEAGHVSLRVYSRSRSYIPGVSKMDGARLWSVRDTWEAHSTVSSDGRASSLRLPSPPATKDRSRPL